MPDRSPTIVFVHGGLHGAWCWQRVLPFVAAPTLAVDLPGRGSNVGETPLNQLRLRDSVSSVVRAVEALDDIVLVGHSMAGLILPQIAVELGDRVRHLVFVGATIPADGQSMIDFTPAPMRWFLRPRFQKEVRRPGGAMTLPPKLAARIFCNDMNADDTAWVLGQLQPDSPSVALEPVNRSGFGPSYARTYVKLARDKAVAPRQADRCIANIAPTEVIDIDSGHNVMVSHPQLLADVLNRVIALAPS